MQLYIYDIALINNATRTTTMIFIPKYMRLAIRTKKVLRWINHIDDPSPLIFIELPLTIITHILYVSYIVLVYV